MNTWRCESRPSTFLIKIRLPSGEVDCLVVFEDGNSDAEADGKTTRELELKGKDLGWEDCECDP